MVKKQITKDLNHYIKERRHMHKPGFFKKIFHKKEKDYDSADIPLEEVDKVLTAAGQKVERTAAEKIVVKEPEQGPVLESKEEVVFKDAETAVPEKVVVEQKEQIVEQEDAPAEEVSSEEKEFERGDSEVKEVAEKPSFFHKFRAMFKKQPVSEEEKEIEEEYEQAEEVLETASSEPSNVKEFVVNADPAVNDVKESLRIAFNTISMLPKDSYDEFRNSDDFKKYKNLVEKYNFSKV